MLNRLIDHGEATACPLCGSAVEKTEAVTFDEYLPAYHVVGRPLPTRERHTEVAACSGCEFLIDLRHRNGVPKTSKQLLVEVGTWLTK